MHALSICVALAEHEPVEFPKLSTCTENIASGTHTGEPTEAGIGHTLACDV